MTEANLFQKKWTVSVSSQDELALEELALDELALEELALDELALEELALDWLACNHQNQIKVNIFLESIRSIKVRLRGQDNMF